MEETLAKFCGNCGAACTQEAPFCSSCGSSLSARIESIPFEQRAKLGFWAAYWDTWKLAATSPESFYPLVGKSMDTASAIWFYLINGMAAVILFFVTSLPFRVLELVLPMSGLGREYGNLFAYFTGVILIVVAVASLILAPLLLLAGLYISAFGWQISLSIVKGAPHGFKTTLRTIAYSYAPSVIPFIGGIWSLILEIIGLSKAHRVDIWKPLVAFLINLCLLLLCLGLLLALVIALVIVVLHGVPSSSSI